MKFVPGAVGTTLYHHSDTGRWHKVGWACSDDKFSRSPQAWLHLGEMGEGGEGQNYMASPARSSLSYPENVRKGCNSCLGSEYASESHPLPMGDPWG